MQKHIMYIIMLLGAGVAITSMANVEPVQAHTAIKIATIARMYQQDVSNQGQDDPIVLHQYGSKALQAAFELEQEYFAREQMICNIGYDVLWDSQDPDYSQGKTFSITSQGLVKVQLAQGSDIYYELACDSTSEKVTCQVNDVILDKELYDDQTLKSFLIQNCV